MGWFAGLWFVLTVVGGLRGLWVVLHCWLLGLVVLPIGYVYYGVIAVGGAAMISCLAGGYVCLNEYFGCLIVLC